MGEELYTRIVDWGTNQIYNLQEEGIEAQNIRVYMPEYVNRMLLDHVQIEHGQNRGEGRLNTLCGCRILEGYSNHVVISHINAPERNQIPVTLEFN